MSHDVLDAAAQSLRSDGGHMAVTAQEGAARVLRDVRAHVRRRRMARVALVQMAAVLIGFGAWAAGSGRLARFVEQGVWQDAVHHEAALKPRVRGTPATDPLTASETPAIAPLIEPATPAEPPVKHKRVRSPSAVARAENVLPPTPVSPDALYMAAHEAHFERKDWAAAVLLWDDYLKSGDARFSVEARYNRALALVRLGRKQEASVALRPFADGDYGSYRRDDAIRLLRWLKRPSN